MQQHGDKTSSNVYDLLSTLREELGRMEREALPWQRDIEDQLRGLADQLTRIETMLQTPGR